jgi:alanyl-tRNA synthetase
VEKPTHFKPTASRHLKDEIKASELVKRVCAVLGGSGGGKPEIAQGGGEKVEMAEDAMEAGIKLIVPAKKSVDF